MRIPALLIAALLLASVSFARPAQAEGEMEYVDYTPAGWDISLALENFGTIHEPGEDGWDREDLDFYWDADADPADVPVFHIEGSTITDEAMSDGEFAEFHAAMLANYAEDPLVIVLEDDPNHMAAGRHWQMIHLIQSVEEVDDDGNAYEVDVPCYSLVTRSDDGVLRMVNFFYQAPESDDGDAIVAATVMLQLDPSLADESGE